MRDEEARNRIKEVEFSVARLRAELERSMWVGNASPSTFPVKTLFGIKARLTAVEDVLEGVLDLLEAEAHQQPTALERFVVTRRARKAPKHR